MAERYQPKYGAKSRKHTAGLQRQLEDNRTAKRRAELEKRLRFNTVGRKAPARRSDSVAALRKARAKRVRIAVVCVAAIVVASVGSWALIGYLTNPYNIRPIPGQEPRAVNGTFAQNGEEEIEPGYYRIVINMSPKMRSGSPACNLNIENVLGNSYTVKVEIRDEQGELLYASGYIQPGQRVMEVELERALAVGEHTVTATYFLYEKGTLEESGSTGTAITITVLP